MSDNPLDILKEAILLERRGRAFYQQVAGQASSQAVREFFGTMAAEEKIHMHILGEQLKSYKTNQRFITVDPKVTQPGALTDLVLSAEVKQQIAAADFEAAAVSAAMLMEQRAVALYSQRAAAAGDDMEQALYKWLADWEKGHLSFLTNLDREIREAIWNDNSFWPF
jgi:rubrerythrin